MDYAENSIEKILYNLFDELARKFDNLNRKCIIKDESKFSRVCNKCGKKFKNLTQWLVHLTSRKYEKYKCHAPNKETIIDKAHACDKCEKKFSNPTSLKTHYRIHTGEGLWACDICDKKFTCSSALDKHTLTHTGEKPFKCDQ